MKCKYTREELLKRACLRTASHVRGVYDDVEMSHTDFLESLFLPNCLVVAGVSAQAHDGGMFREHVVPRVVIVEKCKLMIKGAASDQEIAYFIEAHVKIVYVSRAERERLDNANGLNLRQNMPKGWEVGQSVFARLDAAEIEWYPFSYTRNWPW